MVGHEAEDMNQVSLQIDLSSKDLLFDKQYSILVPLCYFSIQKHKINSSVSMKFISFIQKADENKPGRPRQWHYIWGPRKWSFKHSSKN